MERKQYGNSRLVMVCPVVQRFFVTNENTVPFCTQSAVLKKYISEKGRNWQDIETCHHAMLIRANGAKTKDLENWR